MLTDRPERGIDGPEAAVPGDRDLARDPARLPVAGGAASAAAAASQHALAATSTATQSGRPTPREGSPRPARTRRAGGGQTVPKEVPRVQDRGASACSGSISLLGARLDDLVLTDYRETLAPNSPLRAAAGAALGAAALLRAIRLDAPPGEQVKLPDNDTVWTASADTLERRPSGHAVLGQRRGPDLPDRAVGRRRLHVHGRAAR